MVMGGLLIFAALFLSIYNIYIDKKAEKLAAEVSEELYAKVDTLTEENQLEPQTVPDYVRYPELEMPVVEIDGEYYIGFLEIPQLNLSLPVMAGEWSEAKLKKAPCKYDGSVYRNNMIIAGHNYRSHFSYLKKLEEGAEVHFIDAEGNLFKYTLVWTEIINEYDVHKMTENTEEWDLTLFTCTYGGKERYTLRCIETI